MGTDTSTEYDIKGTWKYLCLKEPDAVRNAIPFVYEKKKQIETPIVMNKKPDVPEETSLSIIQESSKDENNSKLASNLRVKSHEMIPNLDKEPKDKILFKVRPKMSENMVMFPVEYN